MSNDFISAKFGSLSVDNTINNYFPGDGLCAGVSNDFNVDMPWLCAQGVDFRVDATCSADNPTNTRSWGISSENRSFYSLACGEKCETGTNAYHIISGNVSQKTFWLDSVDGLSIGLPYSCKYGNQWDRAGQIVAIFPEDNSISVSNIKGPADKAQYGFYEWQTEPEVDKNIILVHPLSALKPNYSTLWIPDYPLLGQPIIMNAYQFAFGEECKAYNIAAFAHGKKTLVNGSYGHAEGEKCKVYAYAAHAEGSETQALAKRSHSEGIKTYTMVDADYSHTEGNATSAYGQSSHAEGLSTLTLKNGAHAEGTATSADGQYSHTEGLRTYTGHNGAHAEGNETSAIGQFSHAEGIHSQTLSGESYAYVWNGDSSKTKDNPYKSNGVGSFSINPAGGTEGFYIGVSSFADYLNNAIAQGQNPLSNQIILLNSMSISAMLSVLFSALGATISCE